MARYIDADRLIAEYDRVHVGAPGGARKLMVEAPTADVEEVRYGEWIWTENGKEDYEQFWVCSVCKEKSYIETKFCSDCGAKMDGGKNENL